MKKPSGRTTIIIGVAFGLAAAGGLAYLNLSGSNTPPPLPEPAAGQHGPMLALDERVVNLLAGGPYRYAKVGLTVELRPATKDFFALVAEARAAAEKAALLEHQAEVPLILDALGRVVSAHNSNELVTVDGRATLKKELLEAVRTVVGEDAVLNVYFTDLVMQ